MKPAYLSSLNRLFAAPTFPDQERTEIARWLNIFTLTLTFLIVIMGFIVPIVSEPNLLGFSFIAANIVALVANVGALFLMRRGYVKLAANLVLLFLFSAVTYSNIVVFGSIRAPSTLAYFVLVPLAGLLLGKRAMLYFTFGSIIGLVITFLLELIGIFPTYTRSGPLWSDLVVWFLGIVLNMILLTATLHKSENSAKSESEAKMVLVVVNEQLEKSQARLQQAYGELEIRIAQRTIELREANNLLQQEARHRENLLNALGKSEASWRSLVANVPERIATISHDQTITFINRSIGEKTPTMLRGMPITLLHTQPKSQTVLQQSIAQVLENSVSASYESEEHGPTSSLWYFNRVGAIQHIDQIVELILISTDITEQKQTQAALHHAQKLESLGVMAGGIAHDFNNLLTAMLAQSSIAAHKLPADHAARHHIQQVIKAAERTTELTRQMLNYAGRGMTETKPVALNELITDNLHLFAAAIAKNISLTSTLAPTLPFVQGDQGQIQQIVMNLILNGADAIGRGAGTIQIHTEPYKLLAGNTSYGQWTSETLPPGDYVKIEVQDTGCGMDASTIAKIFDPFFTTKRTGRGLGLASVLGIIRAHRGGLYVTSAPGKGATFSIVLPVMAPTAAALNASPETTSLDLANKLVLVIDDESDVREATTDILASAGVEVMGAADGLSGIQLFKQHVTKIDLVLLDLSMPGIDGEETFHQMRAHNDQVPIILISGYDETNVMQRFIHNEDVGFLQKPYSVEKLMHTIQTYLIQQMKRARV